VVARAVVRVMCQIQLHGLSEDLRNLLRLSHHLGLVDFSVAVGELVGVGCSPLAVIVQIRVLVHFVDDAHVEETHHVVRFWQSVAPFRWQRRLFTLVC